MTTETGGLDLESVRARAAIAGVKPSWLVPGSARAAWWSSLAQVVHTDVPALLAEVERLRRQRQAVLDLLSGEMSGVDLVGGRMAFETVVHWRDRCVLAALGVDHV